MAITRFKANGEMGYPDQATPERFNQLVDETNNEISILSWKGLNFKNELAKPSAYQANATTTFLSTEFWFASQYADIIVKVENFNGNIATQWLLPHNALGKPLAYRLAIPSTDSWGAWKQLATTDKIDISFVNGWTNAYGGFSNRPLSIDIIGSKILIEGIITNPATITASTNVATLSKTIALKKFIYAIAYNTSGQKIGETTFVIEGNLLKVMGSTITSLGEGYIGFQ